MKTEILGSVVVYTLDNGRVYHVDENDGNFRIRVPILKSQKNLEGYSGYRFIDISPDRECLMNFLKAASRLSNIKEVENRLFEMNDFVKQFK